MKRLFLAILMLAWAGQAWGATWYVSTAGDNTDGSTWAKAYCLPSQAVTAARAVAGGSHVINIAPGTYVSSIDTSADNDVNGSSFYGVSAAGVSANCTATCTSYPAAASDVVISAIAGTSGLYLDVANISVSNMTSQGSDSTHDGVRLNAAGLTLNNVRLLNNGRYNIYATTGATGFVLNKIWSSASLSNGTIQPNLLINNAAGTINYSIFDMWNTYKNTTTASGLVYNSGTGALVINNSVIIPGKGTGLTMANIAGSITANNTFIFSDTYTAGYSVTRVGTGTITLNNCYTGMSYGINHRILNGTITNNNPLPNQSRNMTRHRRSGYVSFNTDDIESLDWVKSTLEPKLAEKGMKGTFYVPAMYFNNVLYKDDLLAIIARGTFEIGVHAYSHNDLSLTGDITAAGGINTNGATVEFNRAADNVTVVRGGDTYILSGYKTKMWGSSALAASIKYWLINTALCTSVAANVTGISEAMLGEEIADSSGAQATGYIPQLLIDATGATGYYYQNIVAAKAEYLSAFGIAAKSFATPFGKTNATVNGLVNSNGYITNRNNSTVVNYYLDAIDPYQLNYYGYSNFIDAVDQNTVNYTHAAVGAMARGGGVIALLIHGYGDEATDAQLDLVLGVLAQYPEITVAGFGDIGTAIHALSIDNSVCTGAATPYACCTGSGAGLCYTKPWTDTSDYRLLSSSPAINAGVDVGLTTDYLGNNIRGLPDVGAYEAPPNRRNVGVQ